MKPQIKEEERKCDGCKLYGKMGVHSFTCPIRGVPIKITSPEKQDNQNKELKQQAKEAIDAILKIGTEKGLRVAMTTGAIYDYEVEKLKSVIDSLIDKTVQMTEERIRKDVVNHFNNTEAFYGNPRTKKMIYYDDALEIISLITNKSDINK